MDKSIDFRLDRKLNYDFVHSELGRTDLAVALERVEHEDLVRRLADDELAYLFKHALTQDAAYSTLMKGERKRLHQMVAQTLEQLNGGQLDELAARLAQHYAQAGAGAQAAEYFIRAGDASARVFASAEARSNYTAAMEILKTLPETPDTQRALFETMVKYAGFALGAEDATKLFALYLDAEALGVRLLAENNPSDHLNLARLRYEIARVFLTLNEPYKGFAYCDLMLQDAKAIGDTGLAALAVGLKSVGLLDQGHFDQAIQGMPPAIDYLEKIGNWRDWAWMNMNLALALAQHGEYGRALELATRASRQTEETQDTWMHCVTALYSSLIYWTGGEMSRALSGARNLMQLAVEKKEFVFLGLGSLPQMWAESKLGDTIAAAQTHAQRQELIKQVGVEIVWQDWGAAARAELALNAGDSIKALALAEDAVKVAQSVGGIFAEGLARRTWALALVRAFSDTATAVEEQLAKSLNLFEQGEARIEAARTHVAWGNFLLERGNEYAAHEHLEQAAAQFQASGLERELVETRELMWKKS